MTYREACEPMKAILADGPKSYPDFKTALVRHGIFANGLQAAEAIRYAANEGGILALSRRAGTLDGLTVSLAQS